MERWWADSSGKLLPAVEKQMMTPRRMENVLAEARKTNRANVRKRGAAVEVKASIPQELFYRAKLSGHDPKDPDLIDYEVRNHPEEFRPYFEDKPVFSLQHLTPAPGGPTKRKTRFGNVTFHKRYA